MPRIQPKSQQESFETLKSDYSAAKFGRFRRRRQVPVMGSHADYHYRTETDFLRIMEYSRDIERNDAIGGPLVNQAVLNIVQNGLMPDPKTGDDGADKLISEAWWDWASDAQQCSLDGELVYRDMEKMVLRRMIVDGDIFPVCVDSGELELVEGHRCRSPQRTKMNVVHGVLMDDRRRRLQYWFTKEDISPLQTIARRSDITERDAFDGEGKRAVLHVRNPVRPTQTRGVSAFAPIFDLMGMHEDLQFAKLVQQQVASCIAFFRERNAEFSGGVTEATGRQYSEVRDAVTRVIEELAPGIMLTGQKGETIKGFSPNIPNAEFFQQMRTILQLIGINLGIPLVLLMMDASDTNFSGWRGAMDNARMGFKDMQQHLIDHFECPVYQWKVRQFAQKDAALRTILNKKSNGVSKPNPLFAHMWNAPRWPYIQPLQDAQADGALQDHLLSSPRRIHAAKAQDHGEVMTELVEDNTGTLRKAILAAKALSAETGERVTYREVLFLTNPEMHKAVTASITATPGPSSGPVALNGAQITSAVELVGKIRAGTIAPAAATELLVALGMERARADAAVNATPAGQGQTDADRQFLRDLLKAFAANPTTLALVANASDLQPLMKAAGAPVNAEYKEPYVPVVAPAGNLVSGETIVDSDNDVVGGGLLPAGEDAGNAQGVDGGEGGGSVAGGDGENTGDQNSAEGSGDSGGTKPAEEPAGDSAGPADTSKPESDSPPTNQDPEGGNDKPDPEDDATDPEDKPEENP